MQTLHHYFFWFLFLSTVNLHGQIRNQAQFNQAAFDANAKLYGNKTANLIELKAIAPFIPATLRCEVPDFFKISNDDLQNFLQNQPLVSQQIANLWQAFKDAQPAELEALTPKALEQLAHIRKLF